MINSTCKAFLHFRNFVHMTLTIFSVLLIVSINSFAVDTNKTDIKYGYPSQSIFIATVDGKEQLTTPMLSVAEELFKRADLTFKSTSYPAKRLFRNLKNGETNFTILVRASSLVESCIFSKNPIYSTNLNIYYIGDKAPITKKEDLKGTRVATIRGYSYGKLRKFIENPKNNIINEVTNTHKSAFRMLELGRVDYLLDYASAADDIISESNIANLESTMLSKLNIFLVLSKSYPNANDLMNRLETIIDDMDISDIINKSGSK